MLHDEDIFPNPKEFRPERFIDNDDVLDPTTVATFGFGRRFVCPSFSSCTPTDVHILFRICPGSHVARSALYISAASILSLFDILPAVGADGRPIHVEPEFGAASIVS